MNAITPPGHFATAEDWSRFMRPIAAAVRNTPSDNEFRARVAAVAHAVRVPAEWLRQPWRQAEAMRRFQFWPAVFDIAELFADDLKAEAVTRERRERLGDAPARAALPRPIAEFVEVRTPQEIAHVKAAAAALTAELTKAGPMRRTAAPARPLDPHTLLAMYEHQAAEGNTAAALRAATLRRDLQADA